MPKEPILKIIPKPKPEVPSSVNFLFYFSLVLLIISVAGFFFLEEQISVLEEKKAGLQLEIAQKEVEIKKLLTKQTFGISEKIKDFSQILTQHKISSNFFQYLKSWCHPKVRFSSLKLDLKNYRANLSGETENFKTLGEQLIVLKKAQNIKDFQLANISLDKEGKVNFNLTLTLAEGIFTPLENK